MLLEVGVDVAGTAEPRDGLSPGRRVGVEAEHVLGDGRAWPEPDGDVVGRPLHRVHAAASAVEADAVRIRAVVGHATSLIPIHEGEALGTQLAAKLRAAFHGAPGSRMQRHVVVVGRMDLLDDVYLSSVRPIGTERPAPRSSAEPGRR